MILLRSLGIWASDHPVAALVVIAMAVGAASGCDMAVPVSEWTL